MRKIAIRAAVISMLAATGLAQDLRVFPMAMDGPEGFVKGKLVATEDQMIFINDQQPELSFLIPRGDIRQATSDGATLTIATIRPFADRAGARSNLVIRMADPVTAESILTWIGVPGTRTGEASRTVAAAQMPREITFDVEHEHAVGGCNGKLIVSETNIRFESIGEATHSRSWNYGQVEEFDWDKDDGEVEVEPYDGDDYDFKILGGYKMDDTAYKVISDRIVAARPKK